MRINLPYWAYWIITLIVSVLPFAAVVIWADYIRPAHQWDCALDVLFYFVASIVVCVVVWIFYFAVT